MLVCISHHFVQQWKVGLTGRGVNGGEGEENAETGFEDPRPKGDSMASVGGHGNESER